MAIAVACGEWHSCAILQGGVVTCWGNNGQGQLGIGSTASVGTTASTMGSNMQTVDIGPGTAEASFCASAFNYFYGI